MPVTEHLAHLRRTVMVIAVSILAASAVMLCFSDGIMSFLTLGTGYSFIYTSPEMMVVQLLKVAVISGIVISLPVSLLALWSFVRPALTKREKGLVAMLLTFGLLLFFLGVVFAYLVIFPFMIRFFQSIEISHILAYISIADYIDFLLLICLVFGAAFELPVVMALLSRLGMVERRFFSRTRKYADVLILVASAFITPPDVFSMLLAALPLILIYEVGILAAKLFRGNEKQQS